MDTVTANSGTHLYIQGSADLTTSLGTKIRVDVKSGISPKLYFKYIKKKFGILGGMRFKRRIEKLWKLVEGYDKLGQEALSEQFLKRVIKETRETEMYALGYKIFIEKEFLEKFRYKVKGRGISVTTLKNYTRVIPNKNQKEIMKAIKSKLFDRIEIVHYDEDGDGSKMTAEEERKDPIAFGRILESDRYYFITDWEDEYCDLTLDDIVDKLSLNDDEITINKNPSLK